MFPSHDLEQEIVRLAKYILLQALLDTNIITLDQLSQFLNQQTDYQYEYMNVETSTPYVKTPLNYRVLSDVRYENDQDSPSKIMSEYKYFSDNYQNRISSLEINESLLPNMYTRHYLQQLNNINPNYGSENFRAQVSSIKQNYNSLLTLADANDQERLAQLKGQDYYDRLESSIEAGPSREFYKEYSVLFGPENPTYVFASDELLFKNRNFAIGQLQMLDRGLPSVEVVMGLGVQFSRDKETTDFADHIRNHNTSLDPSVAMIENLSSFTEDQQQIVSKPYLYSTEYLLGNQQREIKFVNVNLNTYKVLGRDAYIIDNLPTNYSSSFLQKYPHFPTGERMREAKQFLSLNKLRRRPPESSLLRTPTTRSEVLAYRLTKRSLEDDSVIQRIFLGNAGSTKQIYKDGQVKYGKDYIYDLTEYRFMYGMQYTTFTLSDNLPPWIVTGKLLYIFV